MGQRSLPLAEEAPSPLVTSQLHQVSPPGRGSMANWFAECSQDQPRRGPEFRHQEKPALQRGPGWPLRTRSGRKEWEAGVERISPLPSLKVE